VSSPAQPPIRRSRGLYALLAIVAIPAAAVALWLAILLVLDSSGTGFATVFTFVMLAAPAAAAIWIGVRWRIRAWLIVVACVGAVLMWIPLVSLAIVVSDAVDSPDESGGFFPGGVVVDLLG